MLLDLSIRIGSNASLKGVDVICMGWVVPECVRNRGVSCGAVVRAVVCGWKPWSFAREVARAYVK